MSSNYSMRSFDPILYGIYYDESRSYDLIDLLEKYQKKEKFLVIYVDGTVGVGKSSFINWLVCETRKRGITLAHILEADGLWENFLMLKSLKKEEEVAEFDGDYIPELSTRAFLSSLNRKSTPCHYIIERCVMCQAIMFPKNSFTRELYKDLSVALEGFWKVIFINIPVSIESSYNGGVERNRRLKTYAPSMDECIENALANKEFLSMLWQYKIKNDCFKRIDCYITSETALLKRVTGVTKFDDRGLVGHNVAKEIFALMFENLNTFPYTYW